MTSHLLVAGAGAMGSQIAALGALAGIDTTLYDAAPAALEGARTQLTQRIDRMVQRGRIGEADAVAVWGRLVLTDDLDEPARRADFVIEAVAENLAVKRDLLARIAALAPADAVLTSNSSSFVPSRMADASGRPDRFCNMHFFNPALVMACVEVVRGPDTSDATVAATVELAHRMGKEPVVLDREIPGFVANRIVNAIRDEAIFLHEQGIASVATVDAVCRGALGHPMGPFELMDLTGLDIGHATKAARFAETGDPGDAPAVSLVERVERGDLGRKTGRGWYDYDADGVRIEETR
ncbi:MAG TPA: 3-hydroxyacyl-CoA dehydrogenase family protein [Acidimicrobiales bacterium]